MPKIIIADDDQNVAEILERFLKKQDYETIIATSGKKALGFIVSNVKVDLVIVDLKMTEGIDVMKECLKRKIPFIVITGGIGKEIPKLMEELKLVNYELKDVLYKPVDFNRFLDVVKNKLNLAQNIESNSKKKTNITGSAQTRKN